MIKAHAVRYICYHGKGLLFATSPILTARFNDDDDDAGNFDTRDA